MQRFCTQVEKYVSLAAGPSRVSARFASGGGPGARKYIPRPPLNLSKRTPSELKLIEENTSQYK
jgi:hypothetical protein